MKIGIRFIVAAGIALAFSLPGTAQVRTPEEQPASTVLRNVRIVDVYSGTVSELQDLLIENGVITTIYGAGSGLKAAALIDCDGFYVVPALFDCHTHLAHLTNQSPDSLREAMNGFVRSGVLQVRDVGGPIDRLAELSRRTAEGELLGPEIFYSGPMLESSPLTWEKINEALPGFTVALDSEDDVDRVLPQLAAQGACMVKTFNRIDQALYRHLVEAAGRAGLKIVHDPGTPLFHWMPIDEALDLGVTCFEHAKAPWPVVLKDDLRARHDAATGSGANPAAQMAVMMEAVERGMEGVSLERLQALADRMVARDALLCPTLTVFHEMAAAASRQEERGQAGGAGDSLAPSGNAADSAAPFANPDAMRRRVMAAMEEISRQFVRELAARHVKMLVGQDGCRPGATLEEMELLRDCGVPDIEILRGATLYPAEWLGVADRLGSVSKGRVANLLVLKADPLDDIGNMKTILFVIRKGLVVAS